LAVAGHTIHTLSPLIKVGSQRPGRWGASRRDALEQSFLCSEELEADLAARSDDVCFHWFLASLLFGARISETAAKNTY
jgi:hypothetical protein